MAQYVDSKDRKWIVSITGYEVKRVRELANFNLCALFDNDCELVLELFNDVTVLGDVLWVICEDECKERQVTEQQFRKSLIGESIDNASEAMREAIVDFFPPRRRAIVKRYFEKLLSLQPLIEEAQTQYLDGIDMEQEVRTRINELTGSKSTRGSSNSPESSAVIPTDGVYAN
jgi:hypothetical protein